MTTAPACPRRPERRAVRRWQVAGIGHPDRQDDAVGPSVARAVAALGIPAVECQAPLAILDLLDAELDGLVVVDAVCTGATPGTVHVRDLARRPLPPAWVNGTHGFGLAAVLDLARNLGRVPQRVIVVGVEAAGFAVGAPMSPAVRAAIPEATALASGCARCSDDRDVPG